jgi:hypothetical protein
LTDYNLKKERLNNTGLANFQANHPQAVNYRADRLSMPDKNNGVFFGNNQKQST